jgi:hypothetical protein
MNKNNIRDYAYTAGCIDCDGWISIKKATIKSRDKEKTPRYKLQVGVVGKDARVQQHLQGIWGGNLSYKDNSGKDKRDGINGTWVWYWIINSNQAMEMLKKIRPYLQYKTDQADVAIRLQERMQKAGSPKISEHELEKREELYQECKQLKKVYKQPVQAQRLSVMTA